MAGFEACPLPAREGAELATALGGAGVALGPLCAPDPVRGWFLRERVSVEARDADAPELPHPEDPWCTLVFDDRSSDGLRMGWLGVLPLRSWHAFVESVHALDARSSAEGIQASYGSNEYIEYGSLREWLRHFRAAPCSDALARCLVPALGRHEWVWEEGEVGMSMRGVLMPAWGLLPTPEQCWELLRQHALPCSSMTCYAHGNAVGACDACGAHAHRTSPPRPADPALVRLGRSLAASTRFHAPGRVVGLGEVDVIAWDAIREHATVRAHGGDGGDQAVAARRVLSVGLNGRRPDDQPLARGVLAGLPSDPVWGWRRAC